MDEKKRVPYAVMNRAEPVDECYLVDHARFTRVIEVCNRYGYKWFEVQD